MFSLKFLLVVLLLPHLILGMDGEKRRKVVNGDDAAQKTYLVTHQEEKIEDEEEDDSEGAAEVAKATQLLNVLKEMIDKNQIPTRVKEIATECHMKATALLNRTVAGENISEQEEQAVSQQFMSAIQQILQALQANAQAQAHSQNKSV